MPDRTPQTRRGTCDRGFGLKLPTNRVRVKVIQSYTHKPLKDGVISRSPSPLPSQLKETGLY